MLRPALGVTVTELYAHSSNNMSVDLLVVFFLLLYAVSMVLAQLLILSPPVLTTYLGGDAHFICTIKDLSMEIAWYSSFFPIIFQNNHANFSELHFTVSDISLNNTLLHCIGRNPFTPSKIYSSNSGLIVIQGIVLGGVLPSNNNNAPL